MDQERQLSAEVSVSALKYFEVSVRSRASLCGFVEGICFSTVIVGE